MSGVSGFLGELIVGTLLQTSGHDVQHFGRQHGSDLRVRKLGVDIDVKTSLPKTEIGVPHWGWALLSGSKKKELTFTHLVCVALDDSLEPSALYVIRRADLERFPAGIPPFTNNKHILLLTQDGSATAGATERERTAVVACAKLVQEGAVRRANNAASLVALLRSPSTS